MATRAATSSKTTPDAQTRVCAVYGAEAALKREAYETLLAALEAEHGQVQVARFDGKEATLSDVFDELRSYALMQQHKLVVVDEADGFVSAHRAALERYAGAPVDHASLMLRCDRWYRGKLDKLIAKVGQLIECKPLTAAKAKAWITKRAQTGHDRKLSAAAAGMLVERLGCDLSRLDSEFAKLALVVEPGQVIGEELIDRHVGKASDEQAWAIQEAVLGAFESSRGGGGRGVGGGVTPIEKLHELVGLSRQPDVLVAYFATDLIRKLHTATAMRRAGESDQEIASRMKLWGPRRAAFFGAMRRIDRGAIDRWFDRVVEWELRAKSGLGKPMRNLECFCASLADEFG